MVSRALCRNEPRRRPVERRRWSLAPGFESPLVPPRLPVSYLRIMCMVVLRSSEVKGRSPVSISYMRTPKDHQSALWSWPLRLTTSGAMYSTVPQKEYVLPSASSVYSLLRPKSVSAMWPSSSSRMFSGLRSLESEGPGRETGKRNGEEKRGR